MSQSILMISFDSIKHGSLIKFMESGSSTSFKHHQWIKILHGDQQACIDFSWRV